MLQEITGTLTLQTTEEIVAQYILQEFLPGASPGELTDSTPLITGGILDSLGTLALIVFLEDRFGIELRAPERSKAHLNTLADIASLVLSKSSSGAPDTLRAVA